MLITTTAIVEGRPATRYLGIVTGDAIVGVHLGKDIAAGFRNIFGGRSAAYENELREAKATALSEMEEHARSLGANAIIGVDLDYETVGNGMLMVAASGTAVQLEEQK